MVMNICAAKGLKHLSISKTIRAAIYFTFLTQLSDEAINFITSTEDFGFH